MPSYALCIQHIILRLTFTKFTSMKKLFFLLSVCSSLNANAATAISSPAVSGHWTLAGSPYNVYNDIQIASSQSLIIDAGVSIVMQGPYRILVYGSLQAAGTSALPINFQVADTTGFTTDNATAAGGWHGLQFFPYGGAGTDNSSMQYCNITNTKFLPADLSIVPEVHTLLIQRSLKVSNCNIHNNRTTPTAHVDLFSIYSSTGQVAELAGCSVYDNFSAEYGMLSFNIIGGSTFIHDSKFYRNTTAQSLLDFSWANVLLTNNEIYENSVFGTVSAMSTIYVEGKATLTGNKIHDNTGTMDGAFYANGGFVDIIGNMFVNNRHTSGTCGIVDGGGAMNLAWNSGTITHDSTLYNVKNNIIANNYSPFNGGGIKLYNANAIVTNNQLVNNQCTGGAALYIFDNSSSKMTFKNNIFYGNAHDTSALNSPVIEAVLVTGASILQYDHNWAQYSTAAELSVAGTGYTITGDTTKNIVGADPGMVAPTHKPGIYTGAMAANFALLPTSPCINVGDTVGIIAGPVDIAGNARIYGAKIDMGAYEYLPALGALYSPAAENPVQVYPNPARSQVFVSVPAASGTIEVIDVTGKVVDRKSVVSTLTYFDIHNLTRGVYLVVWNNGSDTKAVQKIVAE